MNEIQRRILMFYILQNSPSEELKVLGLMLEISMFDAMDNYDEPVFPDLVTDMLETAFRRVDTEHFRRAAEQLSLNTTTPATLSVLRTLITDVEVDPMIWKLVEDTIQDGYYSHYREMAEFLRMKYAMVPEGGA